VVTACDLAFVRFRAPDLERMRGFLIDFGLLDSEPGGPRSDRLFMRGEGASPYCHVTERGQAGFAGFGLWVDDLADLERLAAHDGVAVQGLDAPGGGQGVTLRDPDGFVVEVIAGQRPAMPVERPSPGPWNQEGRTDRIGRPKRIMRGPSHVQRLGHVVLGVRDFRVSEAWYKSRFGFLTSDEIQPAPGLAIGAFMRCNRGEAPCDHHTLFLLQQPGGPFFMHAAFEVAGLDDLMAGHGHLGRANRQPQWGVGRHVLGSQIFDYWLDPWGHEVEHWTDGDRLRAADGGGIGSVQDLMSVQWGMEMPPLPGAPT
jgi:catechol 2,3-dioxygenase-like lactoylglutathione lyase family enzyme